MAASASSCANRDLATHVWCLNIQCIYIYHIYTSVPLLVYVFVVFQTARVDARKKEIGFFCCFQPTWALLLIAKDMSRPRYRIPFFLVCKSKSSRSNGVFFACQHCLHTSTVPCQLTARPWNKNRAWKMHPSRLDFWRRSFFFQECTCSCVAIIDLNS